MMNRYWLEFSQMEEYSFNDVIASPQLDLNYSTTNGSLYFNASIISDDSNEADPIVVRRHVAFYYQIIITFFYIFGIGGNMAALGIIYRKETKRYKKQTLMLKSLALNDLSALLGSFVLMYVNLYMPSADARWLCATRVVCRAFGLGSGCVAFVMALERWLALSHPFTYQKHVTQAMIRSTIIGMWTFTALLVYAPFFGFGLWFDESKAKQPCVRYRFATSPIDMAYAYLVFIYGMTMCVSIVICNLSVIRVLCKMSQRMGTRRYSRASSRSSSSTAEPSYNHATPEELSFARLMAVLSIFFVVCWAPQLLTILAAQFSLIKASSQLYRAADVLIALNFTLDPYLYVLLRRQQLCGRRNLKKLGSVLRSSRRKNGSTHNAQTTASSRSSVNTRELNNEFHTRQSVRSKSVECEKEYVPLKLIL